MPGMHFLLALAASVFLLAATALSPAISQAVAQPIFRCGNTYSQEACKGGKVVEDKTTNLHHGHSDIGVYLHIAQKLPHTRLNRSINCNS